MSLVILAVVSAAAIVGSGVCEGHKRASRHITGCNGRNTRALVVFTQSALARTGCAEGAGFCRPTSLASGLVSYPEQERSNCR